MKIGSLLIAVGISFLVSCSSYQKEISALEYSYEDLHPRNLIWSEEFDSLSSNWNYLTDSNGYGNRSQDYRPENVKEKEGNLVLSVRKEESNGFQYTSGAVTTENIQHFKYGKIEVRAKFPKGQGLLPAIWLKSASGHEFPEIDIVEMLGQYPTELWNVIHGEDSEKNHIREYQKNDVHDLSVDYNIYGVEWLKDRVSFYLNGNLLYTATSIIPDEEMFLYINIGVGGDWVGDVDETTKFPSEMLVDYVRYYGIWEDK